MSLAVIRSLSRGIVVMVLSATVACGPSLDTANDQAIRYRETVLAHQQVIAECMGERGFDYVAGLPPDVLIEEARSKAAAEGRDVEAAVEQAQRNAPADPNEKVVDGLTEPVQRAWGDALWGDASWEGCYDRTFAETWGVDLDEEFARADQVLARVNADPAVIAAVRRYRSCMEQRGYHIPHPDKVYEMVGRHKENLDPTGAERYASAAYTAHEECFAPYAETFDEVHRKLGTP